jgi:hypothetical protein
MLVDLEANMLGEIAFGIFLLFAMWGLGWVMWKIFDPDDYSGFGG